MEQMRKMKMVETHGNRDIAQMKEGRNCEETWK